MEGVAEAAPRHPAGERRASVGDLTTDQPRVVVDFTTSVHHTGTPAGIMRVEHLALRGIFDHLGAKASAVAWNPSTGAFHDLERADAYAGRFDSIRDDWASHDDHAGPTVDAGCIFLLMGSIWIGNERYLSALAELKNTKRCRVCVLIHDIAHHKLRDLYGSEVAGVFESGLWAVVQVADLIVTYSKATTLDVADYCASSSLPLPPTVTVRLGDVPVHESGNLSDALPEALGTEALQCAIAEGYALYVSTLDARKNHRLLFDVWRRLVDVHGAKAPCLLLVGRMGLGSSEIMADFLRDGSLGAKVHFLADIDDAALDFLYRNARFTLYPSVMEGWGLPIAESLSYGKVSIVSNTSSMPEIAPELCDLVDPLDTLGWYKTIERYFFDDDALARRSREIAGRYVRRSWNDYAAELISSILARNPAIRTGAVLAPNAVLHFNEAQALRFSLCDAGGWHYPEPEGRWGGGRESGVVFTLAGASPLGWTIRIKASTFTTDSLASRPVEVLINGVSVGRFGASDVPAEHSIPIPIEVLEGSSSSRNVRVQLRTDAAFRPCDIGDSQDTRELSIFAQTLTMSPTADVRPVADPVVADTRVHLPRRIERMIRKWRKSIRGRLTRPHGLS